MYLVYPKSMLVTVLLEIEKNNMKRSKFAGFVVQHSFTFFHLCDNVY